MKTKFFTFETLNGCLSFILFAFMAVVFTACDDDDDVAKEYAVAVTVEYPAGYADTPASGVEVKAVNGQTGESVAGTTNTNGIAEFSLIAGIYNFTVAHETDEFAFNGLLEQKAISEDASLTVVLQANAISGGLVFKEFYYSGSATESGGFYYSDQFMEIYNNSDEVVYLDNIGIGCVAPVVSSSPSVWVDENGNLMNRLPLWGYSFYIKGTGQQYPLEPRSSIVIAQDGIDHKTDPAGNPLSPVNLGKANWELYVGDINGGKDADAAGVPNMTLLHATMTTMFDALYSVGGPAIVAFRFPEGTDPAAFAANEANLMTEPGSSLTTKYVMIPHTYILDAIECVDMDESARNKRVRSDLDAGYTFISEGTYSGKSVRRKVKQIIDGKVIYKDTNNSTEDFLMNQTPSPFVHPTSVDN